MYQTRIAPGAAEAYRSVDLTSRIEGASPHGLVTILYEELIGALGIARAAIRSGASPLRADGVPRAMSILQALEGGLDFEKGGDVARTFAGVYRGLRAQVNKAGSGQDMALLDDVRRMAADLAGAWSQIGRPA